MSTKPALEIAYDEYLTRFHAQFGDKPVGAFVKFHRFMIQKVDATEFAKRARHYQEMESAAKRMLTGGSTISDAIVREYEEAAAWLVFQAPNIYGMFRGEIGKPEK